MVAPVTSIDIALKNYGSETQKGYIDAVNEHGSVRKAEVALGLGNDTIGKSIKRLQERAARLGWAPGHFSSGVAPGYVLGKVTVQRNADGDVVQSWERQSPEAEAQRLALAAAFDAIKEEIPRLDPIERPAATLDKLLNLYTLTDCHVGMLAWRKEGGDDWDLRIAERTLTGCFEQMIAQAPAARVAVVNQLGDFLHSDGLLPVTPTSGHILDQDGRFSKLVAVAIRVLRRICDVALMKHEKVIVVMAEGNHDMASAVWLRHMFKALYENEPRLEVVDSELPYYAIEHGLTMLGFHHGHLKKPDLVTPVLANAYAEIWGRTKKRYAHMGHQHHYYEKEHNGMTVTQHPTLAARDAYAARGGWFAERAANAITYHSVFGQVAKTTIVPEMLEA